MNFSYNAFTLGPVAVPIVYRAGGDGYEGQFGSELKLGLAGKWVAYGVSKVNHIRYDKPEISRVFEFGLAILIAGGTEKLTPQNTGRGDSSNAVMNETIIGVFSPALGVTLGYRDVDLGFFFGYDIGLGPKHEKWNYDGFDSHWFGVSFGYDALKLNLF